ncbi:WXG100 family type VII secretion target [Streptomyces sp. NPDC059788]|uniref:WXG100 family type VII secretion target n=1 Tax=Streptomyces sp. NPDC059788 TaxID=3346948 RepID=UPI0036522AB9
MSAADKAKEIVQDLTGMWWPEGDEDELREAARAWRTFADDVEDVTAAAHKPAQDVIDNNKGPGIEAFGEFWRKYHGGGKGYLDDVASAARDMAKALDKFADQIAEAKRKIEHELEIAGAVLVAGTALALFTGGISEVAAVGATEAIVAAAGTAGVAVSATVAEIAGTVLATAAIGSVEAITVDVVVAQGGRNLLGEQHGINVAEIRDAGVFGLVLGGAFGGAARGVRAVREARLPDVSAAELRLASQDEWITGARRRPRDLLDVDQQSKWADDAYENFRQDSRDIGAISKHSRDVTRGDGSKGFSEEEISSIKKHVFDTEHPIEDYETGQVVTRKFDADPEIADAWIRLRSGNALPEDHILLEHELAELKHLRENPGLTYQEAHRMTNELYNWEINLPVNKRQDFESEW